MEAGDTSSALRLVVLDLRGESENAEMMLAMLPLRESGGVESREEGLVERPGREGKEDAGVEGVGGVLASFFFSSLPFSFSFAAEEEAKKALRCFCTHALRAFWTFVASGEVRQEARR